MYVGNTHLCSSFACCYYVQCFMKETIQLSTHCRWPTISGKARAAQEAWPPSQSPPTSGSKSCIYRNGHRMRTFKRALQNQNLCQQRHQNFTLPKEPALFSQEKGKSLPVHFMCQSDTCQLNQRESRQQQGCAPGSCPGWMPRPPTRGQRPDPAQQRSGPLRPREAPQGAECLILQMRKLTARGRSTPAHGTQHLTTEFTSHLGGGLYLGHTQTWAPVLSDV